MNKTRITLNICGEEYYIVTDNPQDLLRTGEDIDNRMKQLMQENPRISVTQASVFTALSYAEDYKKAEQNTDNMRSQIKEYLEESARARMELEVANREITRLKQENADLRAKR